MTAILSGSSPSVTFSDTTTQATAANVYLDTGTAILFQQTAAPTGWTKVTTFNNAALRIVSGIVTSGGSVDFSTAFSATNTVDGTAISTTQLPAHSHGISDPGHNHPMNDPGHSHGIGDPGHAHTYNVPGTNVNGPTLVQINGQYWYNNFDNWTSGAGTGVFTYGAGTGVSTQSRTTGITTQNAGSGSTHNHTTANFAVKYVDAIICTKN